MNVLVGTALGMGTGGVRSHIESLRDALFMKGIRSELVYPDHVTTWWKGIAALRALGSIDRARVELTKIRTKNARKKVRSTILKENFDLIHVHDVLLAARIGKLSIPVVLTIHGPISREAVMLGKGSPAYFSYLKEMEKRAYWLADVIIAVDTGQKEIIISDYHVPPEKIRVIYNAVDTNLFAPQSLDEASHKPFLLVPRRLVPKNGVHVAVEAFSFVKDMDVELWIAGDGPERLYLEELVAKLNLASKVRFLGSVDRSDIVSLMNKSIGIIIPSVPVDGVVEATSIAALEGMSMAKPVFASNIGGLAEIIKNKETGFLFEAGDAKSLGMLLKLTLGDTQLLQNIGKKARDYVMTNHSLEVWIEQVIGVYRDVLAKQK